MKVDEAVKASDLGVAFRKGLKATTFFTNADPTREFFYDNKEGADGMKDRPIENSRVINLDNWEPTMFGVGPYGPAVVKIEEMTRPNHVVVEFDGQPAVGMGLQATIRRAQELIAKVTEDVSNLEDVHLDDPTLVQTVDRLAEYIEELKELL